MPMRAVYRLHTSVWLPSPRDEVFAFLADARNLGRLTPPFHITTAHPVETRAGTIIDDRIGLRGLT
jgi:ligand-binding SRPBCC domain-containing protein